MKKGDILVYCGMTNNYNTNNKKYVIKSVREFMDLDPKDYLIWITNDIGSDNWYRLEDLEKNNFKYVKDLRKEKLEKLNEKR